MTATPRSYCQRQMKRPSQGRTPVSIAGSWKSDIGDSNGVGSSESAAPNLRPERESSAPTQTGADDQTGLDRAVEKNEGTLDWFVRLSNDVS